MSALTAEERAFLEEPFVGVVTTLNTDGEPQSTVVWVDVDDEGVSVNTAHGRVKPRNSRATRASRSSSSTPATRIAG